MRLSKGDIAFTASSLSVALLLGVWLYVDLNRSANAGNRKPVGKIIFKERVAQRRLSREAVWDNLKTQSPVYDGDTIRTENLSEAEIVLNDDSHIALEENTLIVLNFAGNEARLDFSYGGIRAMASAKSDIKVQSGKTEVSLTGADARLSSDAPDALQVQVQKGSAGINRQGKKEQVGENQIVSLDKGHVEKKDLPATLQSPGDGDRILIEGGSKSRNVAFRWTSSRATVFELSRSRDFRSNVVRQGATGGIDLMLSAGPYFWRVIPAGESPTPPRNLSMLEAAHVILHSPAPGAALAVRGNEAAVQFSWSPLDQASSYEIQIFKDGSGNDPVQKVNSLSTLVSLSLPPGQYSWQVVPKSNAPGATLASTVSSFVVRHLDRIPAPLPVSPAGTTVLQHLVEQKGIVFSWKTAVEGGSYRVQIANNPAFNNPLVNQPTGGASLILHYPLPEGKYFWRLVTEEGQPSGVLDFFVRAKTEVTAIFPVSNRQVLVEPGEHVVFRWQGMQGVPGGYRVLVSSKADLSNPKMDRTAQAEALAVDLEEGTYFWKASQIDAGGASLGESRVERFTVHVRPARVIPIYPPNQALVDMSKSNAILFQWNPVRGALAYHFRLFRGFGPNRKQVFEARTDRTDLNFQKLDLLDTDVFSWDITAVGPTEESEDIPVPFRIFLTEQKEKPEFISPDTIFIK